MGIGNLGRTQNYGDRYSGTDVKNADAAQNPAQQPSPSATPPQPPATAPPQAPAPVKTAPQAPPAPQPQAATPAPTAQTPKTEPKTVEAEENELEVALIKLEVERTKTIKIADGSYIRVYTKKTQSQPAK